MASLHTYVGLFERLRSVNLTVDAKRCLVVRNRNAPCRRCAEACTSGCISVEGNDLAVDASRCIGCGTCATACPTGALAARKPDDRDLAREAAAAMRACEGVVVFACDPVREAAAGRFDPDTVVGVRCAGRVDESLIVLLAAAGAKSVRLVCGPCERCEHAAGGRMAAQVCASANETLTVWGSPARASVRDRFPAACRRTHDPAYDHARRDFLHTMASGARDAAHDAADFAIDEVFDQADAHGARRRFQHVQADGALPRFLPTRRAVLLDALDELGQPADEMIATRLWGHAIVDESRCTGCGMCAVFCPTGALTKRDESGTVRLVHAPGLCLQCRTCEALCPAGALVMSDEVFAVDVGAGVVDAHELPDITASKGGPDAIRNSMSKLIDSPYLWG